MSTLSKLSGSCPDLRLGEAWCSCASRPGVHIIGVWLPEEAAAEACKYWVEDRSIFDDFDPGDWQGIEVLVQMDGAGGDGKPPTTYRVVVSAEMKVDWRISERAEVGR